MRSSHKRVRRLLVLTLLVLASLLVVEGGTASSADGNMQKPDGTSLPPPSHLTGDAAKGKELYQASCVVCHGSRAEGGIAPKLAGNPVLSNDHAFWTIVHEGRHVMPPLKREVTDQQMADIRAWLKTLR